MSKAAVGHERQLRHPQGPERNGRRIAAVAFNSRRAADDQLFLGPATVAYRLRKVYTKLGISSRSQRLSAFRPAQNAAAGQASLDR